MEWIIIVFLIILLIVIIIALIFLYYYKRTDIGKKFLVDSQKPYNKIAPEVYYDKQMLYRKYYALFLGIHYLLTILSIILTTITVYMVADLRISNVARLIVSVLAVVFTNMQMILRFDRVADGCIGAMRVLEQAILEYEQNKKKDLSILLKANKKAEKIINDVFL